MTRISDITGVWHLSTFYLQDTVTGARTQPFSDGPR